MPWADINDICLCLSGEKGEGNWWHQALGFAVSHCLRRDQEQQTVSGYHNTEISSGMV